LLKKRRGVHASEAWRPRPAGRENRGQREETVVRVAVAVRAADSDRKRTFILLALFANCVAAAPLTYNITRYDGTTQAQSLLIGVEITMPLA
jgi:hypothetical protein